MRERKTISKHLLQVYEILKSADRWLNTQEIADAINLKGFSIGIATINRHLRYLINHRICDELIFYPAHLYKLNANAGEVKLCQELEDVLMILSSK